MRARIRFIRFEGTEEKVGTEMNVIKDVMFEGTIRSYSITGTEIQVKMFDDRIVVESPGKLPGHVKVV